MSVALTPHTVGPESVEGFWFADTRPTPSGRSAIWLLIDPSDDFPVGSSFSYEGQTYTVVERLPFLHGLPTDHIELRLEVAETIP